MLTKEILDDLNVYAGMVSTTVTKANIDNTIEYTGDAYGLFKKNLKKEEAHELPLMLTVNSLASTIDYNDSITRILNITHVHDRDTEEFTDFINLNYEK